MQIVIGIIIAIVFFIIGFSIAALLRAAKDIDKAIEYENYVKSNKAKFEKCISQLNDLIEDRKSFLSGDKEHDKVFQEDIAQLKFAAFKLKENLYYKNN